MAAAFCTITLWASSFPAVKYLLRFYSPESIMLLRFLVASCVMLVLAVARKMKRPAKRDIPLLAAGGFVGIFLYMWLFNTGTGLVTSGASSFIIASMPVFTLVLSVLILKEKVSLRGWVGVFISGAGLVLVAISQVTGFTFNWGVAMLVAAAICTSLYNILQRKILARYPALDATVYAICIATGFMLVFLPKLCKELPLAPPGASLLIVYLGVFPAALAYLSWSYALSLADKTSHVTSFMYLEPFIATLFAYFWIGERMTPLAFIGGVIIVGGMVLSGWKGKQKA